MQHLVDSWVPGGIRTYSQVQDIPIGMLGNPSEIFVVVALEVFHVFLLITVIALPLQVPRPRHLSHRQYGRWVLTYLLPRVSKRFLRGHCSVILQSAPVMEVVFPCAVFSYGVPAGGMVYIQIGEV
jgi:hypothetical protein